MSEVSDRLPRVAPRAAVEPRRSRRPVGRPAGARGSRAATLPAERLVGHEAHVRGLAIWVALYGALLSLRVAQLGLLALAAPAPVAALLLCLGMLGVGLLVTGVGLWRLRDWARTAMLGMLVMIEGPVLLAALLRLRGGEALVVVGLSAVVAAPVAWVLLSSGAKVVFAPGYQRLLREQPGARVAWWFSPFFIVPALLLVALVVLGVVGVAVALRYLGVF